MKKEYPTQVRLTYDEDRMLAAICKRIGSKKAGALRFLIRGYYYENFEKDHAPSARAQQEAE